MEKKSSLNKKDQEFAKKFLTFCWDSNKLTNQIHRDDKSAVSASGIPFDDTIQLIFRPIKEWANIYGKEYTKRITKAACSALLEEMKTWKDREDFKEFESVFKCDLMQELRLLADFWDYV